MGFCGKRGRAKARKKERRKRRDLCRARLACESDRPSCPIIASAGAQCYPVAMIRQVRSRCDSEGSHGDSGVGPNAGDETVTSGRRGDHGRHGRDKDTLDAAGQP